MSSHIDVTRLQVAICSLSLLKLVCRHTLIQYSRSRAHNGRNTHTRMLLRMQSSSGAACHMPHLARGSTATRMLRARAVRRASHVTLRAGGLHGEGKHYAASDALAP